MDVLTLNLALQKLQVNRSTEDGQLPLPAANYKYISEMTDWMSSARQYVLPDDLMEEKPAILTDGDKSSSGCICSAVANNLTSSSSSSSSSSRPSIHIPPQSNSPVCLSSLRNSDGTEPQTLVFTDFSILEEGRSEGSPSPASGVLISSEEELSGVDWSHQLGSSGASGTSDDEVCDFMTHVRPSAFGIVTPDFSRPVEVSCRLEPRNIQPPRMSGFAPAKKKAHPISMSCDSAAVIVRPNLDFDKMRKTCYGRRHARHDIKKPKIIRIRSFRESVHCTLQSQFSPSVAAFGLLSRKAGFSPVISVESLS